MYNQKYTKYRMSIYNVYFMNILKQKCLYKWQKATSLGSLSSKKPRISVETVYEKQNRNLDLQLELLETKMSK